MTYSQLTLDPSWRESVLFRDTFIATGETSAKWRSNHSPPINLLIPRFTPPPWVSMRVRHAHQPSDTEIWEARKEGWEPRAVGGLRPKAGSEWEGRLRVSFLGNRAIECFSTKGSLSLREARRSPP